MTERVGVKIPSTGFTFVSGISSSYDETYYHPALKDIVTQREITEVISGLNEGLESFWPCSPCYWFGYGCMICTVGLSLCCPAFCISAAENEGNRLLDDFNNRPVFYDRNIRFTLKKTCCSSFVELSFPRELYQRPPTTESIHSPPQTNSNNNNNKNNNTTTITSETSPEALAAVIQSSSHTDNHPDHEHDYVKLSDPSETELLTSS